MAKKKRGIIRKILMGVIILGILGICATCAYTAYVIHKAPPIETSNIYEMLNQTSEVYDNKGEKIDTLYFANGNRTIVKYDEIPQNMCDAIVSIEDKTFWEHHGFNVVRIIGAIKDAVINKGRIGGTSTITQQLARNLYLADIKSERSLDRKITEAYYTVILEKRLTKEQILEGYLNTVYFGCGNYGIGSAARTYFSKNVTDLDLTECVALAAMPQLPDTYALLSTNPQGDGSYVGKMNGSKYYYSGSASEPRRKMILSFMKEAGYITEEEKEKALNDDLQKHIKLSDQGASQSTSYYIDYMIDTLAKDIQEEMGLSESESYSYIYTGGLKIYTCLDSKVQTALDKEINNSRNYTSISRLRRNYYGDIINSNGNIVAKKYENLFRSGNSFTLKSEDFSKKENGELLLKSAHNLNFYYVSLNTGDDISIEFKDMYRYIDGAFYLVKGGTINIPQGYKIKNDDGDCIIKKEFFKDYPDFFKEDGSSLVISSENYTLAEPTRQPQAAATIIENGTGKVIAMTGGRGESGRKLYNRATNTRQPGSSIKPIAVYGPALQLSVDKSSAGEEMNLKSDGDSWGSYITAGSIINDRRQILPNGNIWPKNSYNGYKGRMSLRRAVQQSVNVCAVKVYNQIGADYSIEMLEKNGITSVDKEGDTNDINPAALALGGMTNGISTLELTAAYSTFVNKGVYIEPTFYTKVVKDGSVVLEKEQEQRRVYDEGVAWIMTDILRSAVASGTGRAASIAGQPVGGKTGTTSNKYDIWFSGFTPKYSMALWEGSDINIELAQYSSAAASFWSKIMGEVTRGDKRESFPEKPSNVLQRGGEYYVEGTKEGLSRGYEAETRSREEITKSYQESTKPTEYSKEDQEFIDDFFEH